MAHKNKSERRVHKIRWTKALLRREIIGKPSKIIIILQNGGRNNLKVLIKIDIKGERAHSKQSRERKTHVQFWEKIIKKIYFLMF